MAAPKSAEKSASPEMSLEDFEKQNEQLLTQRDQKKKGANSKGWNEKACCQLQGHKAQAEGTTGDKEACCQRQSDQVLQGDTSQAWLLEVQGQQEWLCEVP